MTFARIANLFSVIMLTGLVFVQSNVALATDDDLERVCQNNNSALCEGYHTGKSGSKENNSILSLISDVISIMSYFAGTLAVFFVIFGGFKYIISGGEASKISSAKSTILYSLIGLVVVVLSRTLLLFIINVITK